MANNTFLSLVNQTCRRLNEVELTDSNFANAKGFYAHIKDAVNASIRHINQMHVEWPFNFDTMDEILTPGVCRYSFPSDAKSVDFESFRLRQNVALGVNEGKTLEHINYDTYLQNYVSQEDDTTGANGSTPHSVAMAKNFEWVIAPMPDKPYMLTYEYYKFPPDLERSTDVPTIPNRYRHIIVDGACYYAYMFRDNKDAAALIEKKFDDGIKFMRVHLINTNETMQSSMIV